MCEHKSSINASKYSSHLARVYEYGSDDADADDDAVIAGVAVTCPALLIVHILH